MNNQIRVAAVLIGAVLVALTYTFPLWQGYLALLPGGAGVVLPCLPPQATEAFLLLNAELREALLDFADDEEQTACMLIEAHLRPDEPVPLTLQELPDLLGRTQIASGNFLPTAPTVQAQGTVSIYELADGRRLLRFDDFRVTRLDDLQVWLSADDNPLTLADVRLGDIHQRIDPLLGNVGGQNYEIAAQIDLSRYNSVVITSESQNFVVAYAPLLLF